MESVYTRDLKSLARRACGFESRLGYHLFKGIMKPGEVYSWLDQGPVILLTQVEIPDPITLAELEETFGTLEQFRKNDWPSDKGWTVKLLTTGEILDVHVDTLHKGLKQGSIC